MLTKSRESRSCLLVPFFAGHEISLWRSTRGSGEPGLGTKRSTCLNLATLYRVCLRLWLRSTRSRGSARRDAPPIRPVLETNGGDIVATEIERLGCTHAQVGAYLMSLWGPPVLSVGLRHSAPKRWPRHERASQSRDLKLKGKRLWRRQRVGEGTKIINRAGHACHIRFWRILTIDRHAAPLQF